MTPLPAGLTDGPASLTDVSFVESATDGLMLLGVRIGRAELVHEEPGTKQAIAEIELIQPLIGHLQVRFRKN